jgi:hypothetical protein
VCDVFASLNYQPTCKDRQKVINDLKCAITSLLKMKERKALAYRTMHSILNSMLLG